MSKFKKFRYNFKRAFSHRWHTKFYSEENNLVTAFISAIFFMGICLLSIYGEMENMNAKLLAALPLALAATSIPFVAREFFSTLGSHILLSSSNIRTGNKTFDEQAELAISPFYKWNSPGGATRREMTDKMSELYVIVKDIVDHLKRNGEDATSRIEVEAALASLSWASQASLTLISLNEHLAKLDSSGVKSEQAKEEKAKTHQRIGEVKNEIKKNKDKLLALQTEVHKLALLIPEFEYDLPKAPDVVETALKETVALREAFEAMDFPKAQLNIR